MFFYNTSMFIKNIRVNIVNVTYCYFTTIFNMYKKIKNKKLFVEKKFNLL